MARKKTHEEFVAEVSKVLGEEFKVIGEYTGSSRKVKMRHTTCGIEYLSTAGDVTNGSGCPKCRRNRKKTHEEFVADVRKALGDSFRVIGKYVNKRTRVEVEHITCGSVNLVLPGALRNLSIGCPACARKKLAKSLSKSPEQFRRDFRREVGDEYSLESEYRRSSEKVEVLHIVCGCKFLATPNNLLRGSRCPQCKESRGERKTRELLKILNVAATPQFKVDGCVDRASLPFDFAVFSVDGELCGLIEYDGVQHFRPRVAFGGERGLRETQRRDAIKTKYCADNGIPLLRIKYTQFDEIETILTKWLTEIGAINNEEATA